MKLLKVLKTNSSILVFAVVEIKRNIHHAIFFLDVVAIVDYNFLLAFSAKPVIVQWQHNLILE